MALTGRRPRTEAARAPGRSKDGPHESYSEVKPKRPDGRLVGGCSITTKNKLKRSKFRANKCFLKMFSDILAASDDADVCQFFSSVWFLFSDWMM